MFEYQLLTWSRRDEDGVEFIEAMNLAGSEGWQAVGMVPQGVSVPMPGMGSTAKADVAVLLTRRRTA